MRQEQKDSAIAAAVTFVAVLLLLLMLFVCGMTYDRSEMARTSTPELMMPEEEEMFLEPEIIRDLGEEKAETKDAPARAFKGEPDEAPEENNRLNVPGKNPKQAPPVEKKVASRRECREEHRSHPLRRGEEACDFEGGQRLQEPQRRDGRR